MNVVEMRVKPDAEILFMESATDDEGGVHAAAPAEKRAKLDESGTFIRTMQQLSSVVIIACVSLCSCGLNHN